MNQTNQYRTAEQVFAENIGMFFCTFSSKKNILASRDNDVQNDVWRNSVQRSFTGKEKDSETGYYYFGARYYNPDLSLWLSVDPMSDKYPSLSPYNYCAWNPMNLVDPDGAKWKSPSDKLIAKAISDDIKSAKRSIAYIINQLQSKIEKSHSGKRISYLNNSIKELRERDEFLDNIANGLLDMSKNEELYFTFSETDKIFNTTSNSFEEIDGEYHSLITMPYQKGNKANRIHETVHGIQYLKNGGRDFKAEDIVSYEIEAYTAQFCFDPKSLPKSRMPNAIFDIDPPTTITNITRNWVKNAYYINDKGKMIKPYENLP
ncbi:MAG: RHS repeat-associated core domain-containing protein [Bacteroidales bacterium]|nr:RHS repeat-associated core domain-containing protein [Bacteroidales bacterium]